MKVSVVIPAYNEEEYLEKCLISLKNQEEPADEIIVVDNNSSDRTAVIAKKFKVKVLQEKKQGIVHARNKGFDKANYEIIARTDADAILPPNWIKNIKINFGKKKIDALAGPTLFYDSPLKALFSKRHYMYFLKSLLKHHSLMGPNMALTKKIWSKAKRDLCLLPNNVVHEDIDLAIHIARAGGKIVYDDSHNVDVSIRRSKTNPLSFYLEYPYVIMSSIYRHSKLYNKEKSI